MIHSGFRACGVYPFDPTAIPDEAFAPSTVQIQGPSTANIDPTTTTMNDGVAAGPSDATDLSVRPDNCSNTINLSNNDSSFSFASIIVTPVMKKKTDRQNKPAINSRAVHLRKELFGKPTVSSTPVVKRRGRPRKNRVSSSDDSDDSLHSLKSLHSSTSEDEATPAKKIPKHPGRPSKNIVSVREKRENLNSMKNATTQDEFAEGDFVVTKMIYNFGTKKQFEKRFVGVILRMKTGRQKQQYEISFLRKQKSLSIDCEEIITSHTLKSF